MIIDYLGNQINTKAVHELPIYNLKDVQKEVLGWVKYNTEFLKDKTSMGFWKKIDYKDLARSCPALIKYFKHVRIPIQEITVGVLTEAMTEGFTLHHGSPGRNFKINFPILNTDDVYTEWYDIPEHSLRQFPHMINEHTKEACYDLSSIHDNVDTLHPLRVRYNMHSCPIVFNSYIPHRVMPGANAKYPRIMLATMPVEDPFSLMKLG